MTFGAREILEEFTGAQQLGHESHEDGFVVFHPFETRQTRTHRERHDDEWSSWYKTQNRLRAMRWKREAMADPVKHEALKKRNREWAQRNRQVPGKREELNRKQRICRAERRDQFNRQQREYYHRGRKHKVA